MQKTGLSRYVLVAHLKVLYMEPSNPSEKVDSMEKEKERIKEIVSRLPLGSGWKRPLYLYQAHWCSPDFIEGTIFVQQNFKPQPDDIFLCSYPKTGTTWLKALAFAVATRTHFETCQNPLLTKLPHDCVPNLEIEFIKKYPTSMNDQHLPLWSTHLPYSWMPESITNSRCKLVYIWRDAKDTFVSLWHFMNKVNSNSGLEIVSLEEAFELFCNGISSCGLYWDHILGFRKASLERQDNVLFLKYEEMMEDTAFHLKRLAKFIGYPFSLEEENEGVVGKIVELCSFDNLSNLKANKTKKYHLDLGQVLNSYVVNSDDFFRNGKVGDWKNYLSFEMGQKLDKIMEEKLGAFNLN